MSRSGKRNDVIRPKPVEKIELDEKPSRVHIYVFIGFLVLALVSFFFVIRGLVTKEKGWTTINPTSTVGTCATDFVFQYDLGRSELSATKEHDALTSLYTSLGIYAYRLFHESEMFDGVCNLAYISAHPGEQILLDPLLYEALSEITENGNRYLYFAPIFLVYKALFESSSDVMAQSVDPLLNDELMAVIRQALVFCSDPSAISLRFLGENTVELSVSDAYRAFCEELGGCPYLDLFWMKNAFIIDYFAEELTKQGFTAGILSCTAGYVRNLDVASDNEYTLQLPDMDAEGKRIAAVLNVTGIESIVTFRSFGIAKGDGFAYQYEDGTARVGHLSLTSGMPSCAVSNLTLLSGTSSCADMAIAAYAAYTGAFDADALRELASSDVHLAYLRDRTVYLSSSTLKIDHLYTTESIEYTTSVFS